MKLSITYICLLFQNGISDEQNLNTLISILTVGFITLLLLLIINLFKVYKFKKRIKFLEEELKKMK
jgi:hypothetical protein